MEYQWNARPMETRRELPTKVILDGCFKPVVQLITELALVWFTSALNHAGFPCSCGSMLTPQVFLAIE